MLLLKVNHDPIVISLLTLFRNPPGIHEAVVDGARVKMQDLQCGAYGQVVCRVLCGDAVLVIIRVLEDVLV